ncbi:gram-negative porin family protein, partial [Vibrio parahaemolyticus VPTS-2010_2]
MVLKL